MHRFSPAHIWLLVAFSSAMKSRLLVVGTFILALALVIATCSAQSGTKCLGEAPQVPDVAFTCKNDIWQSDGPITVKECTVARFTSPAIINGDLIVEHRASIVYEPLTLDPKPLISVTGCAHFNQSIMIVNLTHTTSRDLVYASDMKEKNGWLYLLPLEANCSTLNVSTLAFEPEIHWDYGISVNSTLITSKKTSITFHPVQKGHSAIQLGFLSGSPIGNLAWFPAMAGLFGACLLIIVGSEWVKYFTAKPVSKGTPRPVTLNGSINGDDSRVTLLEDVE